MGISTLSNFYKRLKQMLNQKEMKKYETAKG